MLSSSHIKISISLHQTVVILTFTLVTLVAHFHHSHSHDPPHSHRLHSHFRDPFLVGGVVVVVAAYHHCSRAHRCHGIWTSTLSTSVTGSDEEASQSSSSSFSTFLFNFSYGNPRIEETRDLMHLFSDDNPLTLPASYSPSTTSQPNFSTINCAFS